MCAFQAKCIRPLLYTPISQNQIKHYTDHKPGDDCHFCFWKVCFMDLTGQDLIGLRSKTPAAQIGLIFILSYKFSIQKCMAVLSGTGMHFSSFSSFPTFTLLQALQLQPHVPQSKAYKEQGTDDECNLLPAIRFLTSNTFQKHGSVIQLQRPKQRHLGCVTKDRRS